MRITFGSGSARVLLSACAITGATLLVAVGCGGGSSNSGSSNGGSGGLSGGTGGGTTAGGDTGVSGTNTGGSNTPGGGSGGDTTTTGEGGEAGEATVAPPPAQDHSAVAFVAGGAISTSAHFTLVGNIGEVLGGTGKTSKSLQHTFIPGVIAAGSP